MNSAGNEKESEVDRTLICFHYSNKLLHACRTSGLITKIVTYRNKFP